LMGGEASCRPQAVAGNKTCELLLHLASMMPSVPASPRGACASSTDLSVRRDLQRCRAAACREGPKGGGCICSCCCCALHLLQAHALAPAGHAGARACEWAMACARRGSAAPHRSRAAPALTRRAHEGACTNAASSLGVPAAERRGRGWQHTDSGRRHAVCRVRASKVGALCTCACRRPLRIPPSAACGTQARRPLRAP
jgi:hypothetical protein